MSNDRCRIGVVAPASRMSAEVAQRVPGLAASLYPQRTPEIVFHPQCFASHGHFAGDDEMRARAFLDIANDESFDAVWLARGGYGSCRVAQAVMRSLTEPSRRKAYVGYDEGEAAVARALAWMVERSPETLEPTVTRVNKTAAFNITVLSQILGTPLQPDLDGHVLMLEEVGEAMYRIDRSLFHITSNAGIRRVSGVMLGRCSTITPNDPDFGMNEEEIARYWCRRSDIAWLGRADIGHDANNKIVPFGASGTIQVTPR
jgi:muramoyltetrapeptide carboxypeptidase